MLKLQKAIIFCLFFIKSFCFWSTGHMIIARIAFNELKRTTPSVLLMIQKELSVIKEYTLESEKEEMRYAFVESAIWADDIKEIGWNAMDPWHFVDTPYFTDYSGDIYIEPMNVTWSIKQQINVLNNKNKPKMNSDLSLSFAWRFLIHLIGDIHQPLHAASLYSKYFKGSDGHGKKFKVDYPKNINITQLHQLWDSCLDQYGSIFAPLNSTEWNILGDFAENLTSKWPRNSLRDQLNITDYKIWIQESHELAIKYAYDGIQPGEAPTQEYILRGREVIDKQLALAGYRLADMVVEFKHQRFRPILSDIFSKKIKDMKHIKLY